MESCGISCWHPQWLRRFANTRWFMIVYGLLGTIQATSYLYFVITLTTIEKRFKIPSQTTGIILSGNEISQILLSLILTYFGGQRNRPRWIAWGVVFSALSCFILAWPHFIYGAGEEAFQLTEEYLSSNSNASSTLLSKPMKNNKLCHKPMPSDDEECDEVFSYVPLVLIFLSQFVLGVGNTLYYSLGQSYLDDNTKQRNTPLMLSYAFAMRMFGPVLGFALGFAMMRIYIDPTLTPLISADDPRWLGAWWLGWLFLGTLMFIFAGLIGMFPKHLPKKVKTDEPEIDGEKCDQKADIGEKIEIKEIKKELKDFPKALMRLLTNKLLIFNITSSVFYILGASGFMTFMGRVMEVQFNTSSARGSIFTGPVTILGMSAGLLISGYVITNYRPPPKYLFFWNVCIGLMSVCSSMSYTQLGCDYNNSSLVNGSLLACNSNCDCNGVIYSPVCDLNTQTTYFSPCHAGCTIFNDKENIYSNCTCSRSITHKRSTSSLIAGASLGKTEIAMNSALNTTQSQPRITLYDVYDEELQPNKGPHDDDGMIGGNDLYDVNYDNEEEEVDDFNSDELMNRKRRQLFRGNVNPGSCETDCKFAYYTFSLISMVSSLISSTGRIGNVLLNFRAVEPRDKAFSQGLALFLISLFALIPGPIIFGRIIDSTCLIWNFKCGRQGNCQLYDPVKFRYYLHTSSAIFIFFGAVFDFLVWYNGANLELYGDLDDDRKPKKSEKTKAKDDLPESEPLNK